MYVTIHHGSGHDYAHVMIRFETVVFLLLKDSTLCFALQAWVKFLPPLADSSVHIGTIDMGCLAESDNKLLS